MFDRPRIIPCLLIENGKLVKTIKFKKPNYLGDPINAVRIYNEKEADELCILNISRDNRKADFHYLKELTSEAFMPLAYGGGIKELAQVKELFRIGIEKVLINTSLFKNPEAVREIIKYAGSQSVIASIDVKSTLFNRKICYFDCGRKSSGIDPVKAAKYVEDLGVGEIFLNSINNDGMMNGYDLDLITRVSKTITIPVIACGGAGNLHDLKMAIEAGAHAAAAGSMFVYHGSQKGILINYPSEKLMNEKGIGRKK